MDLIGIISIVLAVIAIIIVVSIVISRYRVSSPSEAFIVSGSRQRSSDVDVQSSRVVLGGGGIFVVPFVQSLYAMSLEARKINFTVQAAVSLNNIRVNVTGVAIVKVGGDEASVRSAAERFLGQQEDIEPFTQEILEGALRAIVGTMSVDDINRDRVKLVSQITEVAAPALADQGLVLGTLQIQNVTDNNGYIDDLGRPEAARVKRDAEIAEAEARREAEEKRSEAEQAIAEATKALDIKRAEVQKATDAANAVAAASGPIAQAEQAQAILEQERLAAQKRAEVTEKELESTVRKPADAEAYRIKVQAEADRDAEIERAKASAQSVTLAGDAEASAVRARGLAEAEAVKAKSDAYQDYPEAGLLDIAMDGLPNIVEQAGRPIAGIDQLTVVSTDGMDKLTKGATDLLTQTLGTVKDLSGIDLVAMLNSVGASISANNSEPAPVVVDADATTE